MTSCLLEDLQRAKTKTVGAYRLSIDRPHRIPITREFPKTDPRPLSLWPYSAMQSIGRGMKYIGLHYIMYPLRSAKTGPADSEFWLLL